uniref:G protein-coupled receptor 85 n=1 Tax=Eptatretus burgeri TaxID=7764 RepID=A0A8C4WVI3_EPTBU
MASGADNGTRWPEVVDPQPGIRAVHLGALAVVTAGGAMGNGLLCVLLARSRALRRPHYIFLLDLSAADALRSIWYLPMGIGPGQRAPWGHGALGCKILAFFGAFLAFHAAFLLFFVSLTRYMSAAHHRFVSKRLTPCAGVGIAAAAWLLSLAMALPPAFDLGAYPPSPPEGLCRFDHRYFRANDSLGLLLVFAVIVVATHAVYSKLACFLHEHRRPHSVHLVPAVSHCWTFHGPGASGQAAANWLNGFGRGPTPPTLVGVRTGQQGGGPRLLNLHEFGTELRTSRMFFLVSLSFALLWSPYMVSCSWRVLARSPALQFPSATLQGLTLAHASASPLICVISNRELRRVLRLGVPSVDGIGGPPPPPPPRGGGREHFL